VTAVGVWIAIGSYLIFAVAKTISESAGSRDTDYLFNLNWKLALWKVTARNIPEFSFVLIAVLVGLYVGEFNFVPVLYGLSGLVVLGAIALTIKIFWSLRRVKY
jgi:hypothetical protein